MNFMSRRKRTGDLPYLSGDVECEGGGRGTASGVRSGHPAYDGRRSNEMLFEEILPPNAVWRDAHDLLSLDRVSYTTPGYLSRNHQPCEPTHLGTLCMSVCTYIHKLTYTYVSVDLYKQTVCMKIF